MTLDDQDRAWIRTEIRDALDRRLNPNDEAVQGVYDHWRKLMLEHGPAKPRSTPAAKNRDMIRGRLRRFNEDEIKTALDRLFESPHHRGVNPQGVTYLEIGQVMRADDRVEEFLMKTPVGEKVKARDPWELRCPEGFIPKEPEYLVPGPMIRVGKHGGYIGKGQVWSWLDAGMTEAEQLWPRTPETDGDER